MNPKKLFIYLALCLLALWLAGCSSDSGVDSDLPSQTETADAPRKIGGNSQFSTTDCPIQVRGFGYGEGKPECGTVKVLEDRSDPTSKEITLPVVIFRTRAEAPQPDPVLMLLGGPGSAVSWSVQLPTIFKEFYESRDLVVLDIRGVGSSDPVLQCDQLDSLSYMGFNERTFDPNLANNFINAQSACRQSLVSQDVNLDLYTTDIIIQDLIDVRRALGYQEWNIFGYAYGTRLAMKLMEADPLAVRSVTMISMKPVNVDTIAGQAKATETALNLLFTRCTQDSDCNQAFPDLKNTFYELVYELNAHPITVKAVDPNSGDNFEALVDGYRLIDTILTVMTLPGAETIHQIPRSIYQLTQGKSKQFAIFLGYAHANANMSGMELYFKINCSDEWAYTSRSKIEQALYGMEPALVQYFLLGLDAQIPACEVWNASSKTQELPEPITSNIPTLILTVDYDWNSPADWARTSAKYLSNATVVEFTHTGQIVYFSREWGDCAKGISNAFLNAPQEKPDTSCALEEKEFRWITLP